jgi:hypothetical protein
MPHPFDFDPLWSKAQLFMERGLEARAAGREDEWPLWASLAAELLGKAALAKRHPVLVAHPGDEHQAMSLLSAAGVAVADDGQGLQSIPMKTVVSRLGKAIPAEFDDRIQKDLKFIAGLRNEELHSGALPYTGLKESSWAPGFWRAIDILLRDIGKSVDDFVGPEIGSVVNDFIESTKKEIAAEVHRRTGLASHAWAIKAEAHGDEEKLRASIRAQAWLTPRKPNITLHDCPVCRCSGELTRGWAILSESRRILMDRVVYDHRYRAERFRCSGCELELEGTAQLAKAHLPVDVAVTDDFSQEWEPDYGND